MGIQDDGKDPHRRDTIPTYVRERRVIPAEVGLTSYRVHNHDESRNDETMRLQLDLIDEVRSAAEQRIARYQDRMARQYNSRVQHRDFQVGDLVLKKVMGTTRDPTQGKLGPNWEEWYAIYMRNARKTKRRFDPIHHPIQE